ncbi:DNA-binding transcriptional regulator, GntR family [Paracoccus isoporae]|uniref:DNA-binding transcriptional regulator, GntR family n=1 Tax=Paracoccus isoporae TaxID=591205 RepID=A0A1G7DKI7_9RHOB|nr:GntR family transcriptional regulator [Paracoccus isoporae]SDE52019.1 DNA-binding transcriptional regulator, GntR family [Paracoccus isoporae]
MSQAEEFRGATLPVLDEIRPPTITDQIYDLLYERVINLTLPPGTKLSEAEVAAQMGVSRQPVRDAFYRLSQQGFINIRPQRATTVTRISEAAILQAHFLRLALETACMRRAAEVLTPDQHDAVGQVVRMQKAALDAGNRGLFHRLDEQFHHDIYAYAGLDFVWTLIRDNKGHMDRARFTSLSYNAENVITEHLAILVALRARDADAAIAALDTHLSRIHDTLERLRKEQPEILGR